MSHQIAIHVRAQNWLKSFHTVWQEFRMQVASLAELRMALRTATSGDTIELAPGEYRGPLIIETPVTLRGQDRKTVVWRQGGPVIHVRTPGVRLERLLLERTVYKDGPL